MFHFSPGSSRRTPESRSSLHCCLGMPYGAFAYAVVSILAYSIWAFRLVPGPGLMYGAIAVVYLGLSGLALSRLLLQPDERLKFCLFFAFAFLAYALFWCLFWFGLKGKFHADLYGSAVGLAAMTWLFQKALGREKGFLVLFSVLFTCHTLGYYLGGEAYALVHGPLGRLLWGAGHGLGFGAGLGFLIHQCQSSD